MLFMLVIRFMGFLFNVLFNIYYCYFIQGYLRKGVVLFKFYRFEEVCEVFFDGLRVNLDNVVLKEGMEDVKFYFIGK